MEDNGLFNKMNLCSGVAQAHVSVIMITTPNDDDFHSCLLLHFASFSAKASQTQTSNRKEETSWLTMLTPSVNGSDRVRPELFQDLEITKNTNHVRLTHMFPFLLVKNNTFVQ